MKVCKRWRTLANSIDYSCVVSHAMETGIIPQWGPLADFRIETVSKKLKVVYPETMTT